MTDSRRAPNRSGAAAPREGIARSYAVDCVGQGHRPLSRCSLSRRSFRYLPEQRRAPRAARPRARTDPTSPGRGE